MNRDGKDYEREESEVQVLRHGVPANNATDTEVLQRELSPEPRECSRDGETGKGSRQHRKRHIG